LLVGARAARGIGLDDVAGAIAGLTADLPVGTLQGPQQSCQIGTNGQLFDPQEIGRAIVVYRDGAPVRNDRYMAATSGKYDRARRSHSQCVAHLRGRHTADYQGVVGE
jgi:hypothetical protein